MIDTPPKTGLLLVFLSIILIVTMPISSAEGNNDDCSYDVLLQPTNIVGHSNEIIPMSKPILDAKNNVLYNSAYIDEAGTEAILRLGQVLANSDEGTMLEYNGYNYLVTSSANYRMSVAPAIDGDMLAVDKFNIDSASAFGEGLKAQYVVADDIPSLYLAIEGADAGFVKLELELSEMPYNITDSVRELSGALDDRIFWVSVMSPYTMNLAVAQENLTANLRNGKSIAGIPMLKVNDPKFTHFGLSVWGEELNVDSENTTFLQDQDRIAVIYDDENDKLSIIDLKIDYTCGLSDYDDMIIETPWAVINLSNLSSYPNVSTPTGPAVVVDDGYVTITGSGCKPGNKVHIFIEEGGVFNFNHITPYPITTTMSADGTFSYDIDPPLKDGYYEVTIVCETDEGELITIAQFSIVIDTGSGSSTKFADDGDDGGSVVDDDDGDDPRDTPPPVMFGEEIDPETSVCKAYVFVGNITFGTIGDFLYENHALRAADEAQLDFENAGYESVPNYHASVSDMQDALRDDETKAIWFVGHGYYATFPKLVSWPHDFSSILFDPWKQPLTKEVTEWVPVIKTANGKLMASEGPWASVFYDYELVNPNGNLNQVTFHSCGQDLPSWKAAFSGATFDAWSVSEPAIVTFYWQLGATYPTIDPDTCEEAGGDEKPSAEAEVEISEASETSEASDTTTSPSDDAGSGSGDIGDATGEIKVAECGGECSGSQCSLDPTLIDSKVEDPEFGSQTYNFYVADDDYSRIALLYGVSVENGSINKSSISLEPIQADFDVTMTYGAVDKAVVEPQVFDKLVVDKKIAIDSNTNEVSDEVLLKGFQQLVFPYGSLDGIEIDIAGDEIRDAGTSPVSLDADAVKTAKELRSYMESVAASDEYIERIVVDEDEARMEYRLFSKLLGLIDVEYTLSISIDSDKGTVKLNKPWWFLFADKDSRVMAQELEEKLSVGLEVAQKEFHDDVQLQTRIVQMMAHFLGT